MPSTTSGAILLPIPNSLLTTNVHCTVSIYQTNNPNAIVSNLVGGEDVPFKGLSLTNDEWTGTVRVYRLGTGTNANNANDAIQVYNLKVQLEDSTDTDITYARVDRTIASVDLDNGTITAELPANVGNDNDNVPTNMGAVWMKSPTLLMLTMLLAVRLGGCMVWTFVQLQS